MSASWGYRTGGGNCSSSAGSTELSATCAGSVSVGDLILVSTFVDKLAGATGGAISDGTNGVGFDDLGNAYTLLVTNGLGSLGYQQIWMSLVDNAGTPTLRLQMQASPGTTTATYMAIAVDAFSGANGAVSVDDTVAQLFNTGNYTASDAISMGPVTPLDTDALIYGGVSDVYNGGDPGSVGTGFTGAQLTAGSGLVKIRTEWLQHATETDRAITWTASENPCAFVAVGVAITRVPNDGSGTVPYSYAVSGTGAGIRVGTGSVEYGYAVTGAGGGQRVGIGTVPYSYAVTGTGENLGGGTPVEAAPSGAYAAYSQALQRRLAEWANRHSPPRERKKRKRTAKQEQVFEVFVPEAEVRPFLPPERLPELAPPKRAAPPAEVKPVVVRAGRGRLRAPAPVVRGSGFRVVWSPEDDAETILLLTHIAAA